MSNIGTYNYGKELRFSGSPIKPVSPSHDKLSDTLAHGTDRGAAISSKKTSIKNLGSLLFGTYYCEKSHTGRAIVTLEQEQDSLLRTKFTLDSFHLTLLGLFNYRETIVPNYRKLGAGTNLRNKPQRFLNFSRLSSEIQNLLKDLTTRRFYRYRLNIT